MTKTREDLAKNVLRKVLGVVRYGDDIPQARLAEVIEGYDTLYAEMLADNVARTIEDGLPVVYAPDAIPDQLFQAVSYVVGARCAPAFSVDDPPDELESMRWLYARAEIPKTRKTRMVSY